MAPRPKNPPPDRRQEILDSALRLFAEKGYSAATNADIAREAGVTPAALYYYFPSKADLFKAAMTERKSAIFPNVEQMADQVLDLPPEVLLPTVIQALSAFLSDERTRTMLRIVLAEGPRNPEVLEVYNSQVLGQIAPLIMRYFTHHMEQGHIKPMDPRLFALLLNSSVFVGVILRDILKLEFLKDLTADKIARGIIETLLPAMLVQNKE